MEHHRPTAGAPIICAHTRKLIAFWSNEAPLIPTCCRTFEFIPRLPAPAFFGDAAIEEMFEPVARHTIWQAFGHAGEEVQVWTTDVEDPEALRGLRWFTIKRPVGDEGKIVEDFLKLRVASIVHPSERQYLEDYARAEAARNRRRAA